MQEAIIFLEKLKEKEVLEEQLSSLNKEIYQLEQKLYDTMQSMNSDSITIAGIEFKPQIDESFSLSDMVENWSDPEVFNWFKSNNMGDIIKTKEEIHHATRTASLKEFLSSGGKLPEFIKQAYRPMIKYNKSALKRLANEK